MKSNKTNAVEIAVLQEQVKTIKENDLVHLAQKVDKVDQKVDELGTNFESRFDALDRKVAKWGGGLAVIVVIIEIISFFKK